MKITKQDINKLKQLDRIEYRQKIILNEVCDSSNDYLILSVICLTLAVISSFNIDSILNIVSSLMAYIVCLLCYLLCGLYLYRYNKRKNEIQKQYFKSEAKLK